VNLWDLAGSADYFEVGCPRSQPAAPAWCKQRVRAVHPPTAVRSGGCSLPALNSPAATLSQVCAI